MKKVFFVLSIVFLLACEKEYFPDVNAYRDEALFGTWINRSDDFNDSVIIVFTRQGYYDIVNPMENAPTIKYTDLDGIWHISKKIEENSSIGEIYSRSTSSNLSNKGWERLEDYRVSNSMDTLFKKGKNEDKYLIFLKYRFQLIYDGARYVGIDSIN
ncbi:MAG: hypothetical protein IPM71_16045 [Bacteroidota bacterium]|nr:MAG: hypothetical protein IPM71_16045 [Bacteroidota bacterium]